MKRFHVHVAVSDLQQSIRFYSALFDAPPSVTKTDYAKWMLEDPRVNFAISARGAKRGVDHLGIQVEAEDELRDVYGRLKAAERPVLEQGEVTCCYARSEKSWISDPEGIAWETFLTRGESTVYGESAKLAMPESGEACCVSIETGEDCCAGDALAAPRPAAATASACCAGAAT